MTNHENQDPTIQTKVQLTSATTNTNVETNLDLLIQEMNPLAAEQLFQYLVDQLDLPIAMENTRTNCLNQEYSESRLLTMESYSSSANVRSQENNPIQSLDLTMNQNQFSTINNCHGVWTNMTPMTSMTHTLEYLPQTFTVPMNGIDWDLIIEDEQEKEEWAEEERKAQEKSSTEPKKTLSTERVKKFRRKWKERVDEEEEVNWREMWDEVRK